MKLKYIRYGVLIVLFLVGLYSVSSYFLIDAFSTNQKAENITFTGNQNQTKYLLVSYSLGYFDIGTMGLSVDGVSTPSNAWLYVGTEDGGYEWQQGLSNLNNIISYYTMDKFDGTTVPDYLNVVNGTNLGNTVTGGYSGNAVNCSGGANGVITLPRMLLNLTTSGDNSTTIAFWFNTTAIKQGDFLMYGHSTEGAGSTLMGILFKDVEGIYFTMRNIGNSLQYISYKTTELHKWNHITFRYDSDTYNLSMFYNGTLVNSTTITNGLDKERGTDIWLCNKNANNLGYYGLIDEVYFFDDALTDEDIYKLAHNTTVGNYDVDVLDEVNDYVDGCSLVGDYCYVPFKFHSNTAGILGYYSLNFTQNQVTITNCTTAGAGESMILNFSFSDEQSKDILTNFTIEAKFESYNSAVVRFTPSNFSNISSFGVCIDTASRNITMKDAEIRYYDEKSVYSPRFYHIRNQVFDNVTDQVTLYALEDSEATEITFTVKESSGSYATNHIVRVYRHRIGEVNEFDLIASGITAFDGTTTIPLETLTAPYRFVVLDTSGTPQSPFQSTSSNQDKLLETTAYDLILGIGVSIGDFLDLIESVDTSLTFNSTSLQFVYTYNDSTSETYSTTLRIVRIRMNDTHLLYENEFIGNTASAVVGITNQSGTYIGTVYLTDLEGNTMVILQESYDIKEQQLFDLVGLDGLFATLLLMITYAFMATTDPILVVVFSIVGLLLVYMLGIFNITILTLMTFGILAGGIFFYQLVKRRKQ